MAEIRECLGRTAVTDPADAQFRERLLATFLVPGVIMDTVGQGTHIAGVFASTLFPGRCWYETPERRLLVTSGFMSEAEFAEWAGWNISLSDAQGPERAR